MTLTCNVLSLIYICYYQSNCGLSTLCKCQHVSDNECLVIYIHTLNQTVRTHTGNCLFTGPWVQNSSVSC